LRIYLGGVYHQGSARRTTMTAAIDIPTQHPEIHPVRRPDASIVVLSTAELAECTCPDWCERDHDRD